MSVPHFVKAQDSVLAKIDAACTAEIAPNPLPPELPEVDPLPIKAMPDAFRPWVEDVAERMSCPPDYVAVPLIVSAAFLAARVVRIRPQAATDWTETGNLWAGIVGRPGVMKSPALAQALAPLRRLEDQAGEAWGADATTRIAREMAAKLRAKQREKTAEKALSDDVNADVTKLLMPSPDEIEVETRKRYTTTDSGYEALGELLRANPSGVLVERDELRPMLMHLSKEDQAQARGFFLQAWSGGPYQFDRIIRGHVKIADARLSVVGGVQPGPLSDLVRLARRGAADDGLLERFLWVWPDLSGQWTEADRMPDSAAKRAAWGVFDRLDRLTPEALRAEQPCTPDGRADGTPFLRFADDSREAFAEWRADLERRLRSPETEGYDAALSKFRHHVPAIALALHLIDGGTGPVSLPATLRALTLAEYFESHTRRVWSSSQRSIVQAARAILAKARSGALASLFAARNVYRMQWAGLSDRVVVEEALDMLAALGWLNEDRLDTGGRPTTVYSLTEGARRGQVG